MKRNTFLLFAASLLLIQACGTAGSTVSRVDSATSSDLSGRWNNNDADMVAKEMMADMMSSNWLNKFTENVGREPVLIVGKVSNQSMEHIDSDVFTKEIERQLVNSGEVSFVARPDERKQIRNEVIEQQRNSSYESMKSMAQEVGADFMMIGNISSIVDQNMGGDRKSVV